MAAQMHIKFFPLNCNSYALISIFFGIYYMELLRAHKLRRWVSMSWGKSGIPSGSCEIQTRCSGECCPAEEELVRNMI